MTWHGRPFRPMRNTSSRCSEKLSAARLSITVNSDRITNCETLPVRWRLSKRERWRPEGPPAPRSARHSAEPVSFICCRAGARRRARFPLSIQACRPAAALLQSVSARHRGRGAQLNELAERSSFAERASSARQAALQRTHTHRLVTSLPSCSSRAWLACAANSLPGESVPSASRGAGAQVLSLAAATNYRDFESPECQISGCSGRPGTYELCMRVTDTRVAGNPRSPGKLAAGVPGDREFAHPGKRGAAGNRENVVGWCATQPESRGGGAGRRRRGPPHPGRGVPEAGQLGAHS